MSPFSFASRSRTMYSQYKLDSGCMGQALLTEQILGHVFPKGIAAHFAEVNEIVTNLLTEGKPANSIGRTYSFIYDWYKLSKLHEYFDAFGILPFLAKRPRRVVRTGYM